MGVGPHTLSPDPEQDAQHAPPPAHHPNPELLQGTPPGPMIPNATQAPHQVGQQHVPQHVAPQPHPALLQHATSILLQSMPTFANALNTNPQLAQLLIAHSSPPNLLSIHQLWDVAGRAQANLPLTQGGTHNMHNRFAMSGVNVGSWFGHSFYYWPPTNLWRLIDGRIVPVTNSWFYMPLILYAMGQQDLPLPTHLIPPHQLFQIQAAVQLLQHQFQAHGISYHSLSSLMDGPAHYPALIQESLLFLNPVVGMWATELANALAQSVHPNVQAHANAQAQQEQNNAMNGIVNPLIALLVAAGLVANTTAATRPLTCAERVRLSRAAQNEARANAARQRNTEQRQAARARQRMPHNHTGDHNVVDQPHAHAFVDQPPAPIVADQPPPAHVAHHQPPVPATRDVALKPPHELAGLQKHSMGGRTVKCVACNALLWRHEVKTHGTGGVLCCNRGKSCTLQNVFPQPFPEPLESFLVSPTPNSRVQAFRKNIRAYGSALQMASSRLHLPQVQGISMIVIRGAVHHLLGPLQPGPGEAPKFAQLYIIDDPEQQVQARMQALGGRPDGERPDGGLDRDLLRELQQMLQHHNVYVHEFKNFMHDIPTIPEFELFIRVDGSVDRRRYNAPTANEVAGFMPGKCANVWHDVSLCFYFLTYLCGQLCNYLL